MTGDYTLPDVNLPDIAHPVEMQAVVVAPSDAPGIRPLVLLLHGVSASCYDSTQVKYGEWPCADGRQPVPNYRGYLQTQQLLASQGYVTVSVSANGITRPVPTATVGRRRARRWYDATSQPGPRGPETAVRAAPEIVRAARPPTSRGSCWWGTRAAAKGSTAPSWTPWCRRPPDVDGYQGSVDWTIRGQVLIGSTIFLQNPVPDVPSVSILPGCDGDVNRLGGQLYVDLTRRVGNGVALHSALYVVGANHNFFNTEWTPGLATSRQGGDDAKWLRDPTCSADAPTRLTADQQLAVGATYVAAAAQLFLSGDDRVRPLLDGSGRRAPSADPGARAQRRGRRRAAGRWSFRTRRSGSPMGRVCLAVTPDPATVCLKEGVRSPHFDDFLYGGRRLTEAGRYAIDLVPQRDRTVTLRPRRPVDLTGSTHLALRIAVSPNARGKRYDVAVVDTRGRRTPLGRVRIDGLPSSRRTVAYWAQEVRVPLTKLRGRVAQLELTPRDSLGEAILFDAWGWRAGTPEPRSSVRLRIDVREREGTTGSGRGFRIPVIVQGRGSGSVRIFAVDRVTREVRSWVDVVRSSTTSIAVPFALFEKSGFGAKAGVSFRVRAVRGVMVGDPVGRLIPR